FGRVEIRREGGRAGVRRVCRAWRVGGRARGAAAAAGRERHREEPAPRRPRAHQRLNIAPLGPSSPTVASSNTTCTLAVGLSTSSAAWPAVTAFTLMCAYSGRRFSASAYCTVSMVTAAFDEASDSPPLPVRALATFTMRGAVERRRSGSIALVTQ